MAEYSPVSREYMLTADFGSSPQEKMNVIRDQMSYALEELGLTHQEALQATNGQADKIQHHLSNIGVFAPSPLDNARQDWENIGTFHSLATKFKTSLDHYASITGMSPEEKSKIVHDMAQRMLNAQPGDAQKIVSFTTAELNQQSMAAKHYHDAFIAKATTEKLNAPQEWELQAKQKGTQAYAMRHGTASTHDIEMATQKVDAMVTAIKKARDLESFEKKIHGEISAEVNDIGYKLKQLKMAAQDIITPIPTIDLGGRPQDMYAEAPESIPGLAGKIVDGSLSPDSIDGYKVLKPVAPADLPFAEYKDVDPECQLHLLPQNPGQYFVELPVNGQLKLEPLKVYQYDTMSANSDINNGIDGSFVASKSIPLKSKDGYLSLSLDIHIPQEGVTLYYQHPTEEGGMVDTFSILPDSDSKHFGFYGLPGKTLTPDEFNSQFRRDQIFYESDHPVPLPPPSPFPDPQPSHPATSSGKFRSGWGK